MILDITRQTFGQLRSQRMLSVIAITGTALSIFLIMVVVMIQDVKVVPFSPESNRDRFLHALAGSMTTNLDDKPASDNLYENNGSISYETAMEQFGRLKTPEAVTIYSSDLMSGVATLPGRPSVGFKGLATDGNFWKVFDFTFISGKPYTQADFESASPLAVLSASSARRIFGSTDVVGQTFSINHRPYRVAGVVKDVSTLADHAYAEIWVPLSTTPAFKFTWMNGWMGNCSVTLLARSQKDFDAIRNEYEKRVAEMNKGMRSEGWKFITRNRPYTQEKDSIQRSANLEPDMEGDRRQRLIVYLILLIVPAMNMNGMTESRLRQRTEEIGVRRAFGARRSTLFCQILWENFVVTVVAGMIGWLLSAAFAYFFSSFLFANPYLSAEPTIDISVLLSPSTFFWALLFCFVLNVLSTGIPAWRASRTDVVNALKGRQ